MAEMAFFNQNHPRSDFWDENTPVILQPLKTIIF
jgi:hypothetical protein